MLDTAIGHTNMYNIYILKIYQYLLNNRTLTVTTTTGLILDPWAPKGVVRFAKPYFVSAVVVNVYFQHFSATGV